MRSVMLCGCSAAEHDGDAAGEHRAGDGVSQRAAAPDAAETHQGPAGVRRRRHARGRGARVRAATCTDGRQRRLVQVALTRLTAHSPATAADPRPTAGQFGLV